MSIFSNPLGVMLIVLMIILVIAIALLGYILIGLAEIKLKNSKTEGKSQETTVAKTSGQAAAIIVGLMMISTNIFAQNTSKPITDAVQTIGGLSSGAFYTIIGVIFFELLIILSLLINIRLLIAAKKQKLAAAEADVAPALRTTRLNWWSRFNKFKPLAEEKDLDLGHDYDGIRELNNKLPPWWLYGFYLTIVFAAVYLWRYHVSHSAPLSHEEYEIAVQKADEQVKEYLKQQGESVDENTVVMLGGDDIGAGKQIFQTTCVACHSDGGAGNVGPNLTDDYWLHGGDIKSVFKTIKYGINAMPQWQNSFSNKQIAQLASYVKSLKGTHPANAKAPQGELDEEKATTDSVTVKSNKTVMK
jgi:cytochrome c oxidase cbb3-type subunit 3